MSRYYCPQVHDSQRSWIDLPTLASKREKEANEAARQYAEKHVRVVRVIRKPHGWTPG